PTLVTGLTIMGLGMGATMMPLSAVAPVVPEPTGSCRLAPVARAATAAVAAPGASAALEARAA
ncbi:hypothetical protein OSI02_23445, partial [Mycobacterium ulcerans]